MELVSEVLCGGSIVFPVDYFVKYLKKEVGQVQFEGSTRVFIFGL